MGFGSESKDFILLIGYCVSTEDCEAGAAWSALTSKAPSSVTGTG